MLFLTSNEVFEIVSCIVDSGDRYLDELFQRAFTMTAMDRRPFAPPLESPEDRLVNMRNVCEKFKLRNETVRILENFGFRSVTLLSLMSGKQQRIISKVISYDGSESRKLSSCIRALNESPLEPLYSLKRYLRSLKKKDVSNSKRLIAELDVEIPLPPPTEAKKNKKDPPLIIDDLPSNNKSKNKNKKPLRKHIVKSKPEDTVSLPPSPKPPNGGSFGDYSFSGSSCGSSTSTEDGDFRNNIFFICPMRSCEKSVKNLYRHMKLEHRLVHAELFTTRTTGGGGNSKKVSTSYASVEMQFSLADAFRVNSGSIVYFGPSTFEFDGIRFYEVVYRIPEKNSYDFRVWAEVPPNVSRRYSFVISLFSEKIEPWKINHKSVIPLENGANSRLNNHDPKYFFSFREEHLRIRSFSNGYLKYFVKIYKNKFSNNCYNRKRI